MIIPKYEVKKAIDVCLSRIHDVGRESWEVEETESEKSSKTLIPFGTKNLWASNELSKIIRRNSSSSENRIYLCIPAEDNTKDSRFWFWCTTILAFI